MPSLSPATLALIQARRDAGLSQTSIARMCGISTSSLSLLIRGLYPARDLDAMERRVMAALGRVECPHLGRPLDAPDCLAYRDQPIPTSDPVKLRHWRACQACPVGNALKGV